MLLKELRIKYEKQMWTELASGTNITGVLVHHGTRIGIGNTDALYQRVWYKDNDGLERLVEKVDFYYLEDVTTTTLISVGKKSRFSDNRIFLLLLSINKII